MTQHADYSFLHHPTAGLLLEGPPANLERTVSQESLLQLGLVPRVPTQNDHSNPTPGCLVSVSDKPAEDDPQSLEIPVLFQPAQEGGGQRSAVLEFISHEREQGVGG